MPLQTRHPGVYVEEVPSGVHTIVGVSTSVTAFVGATRMGPVGRPVRVRSIPEFIRAFGPPIDEANPLGHSVVHFFANGGSEAIVVRAARGTATTAKAKLKGQKGEDLLLLEAASPGGWATEAEGLGLGIAVERGDPASGRFDLTLTLRGLDPGTGASVVQAQENYPGVTMAPGDRRYVLTALAGSQLVKATLGTVPDVHGTSQSKEELPGNVTLSGESNRLRVAVDGKEPHEVTLFASEFGSNPAPAGKTRASVETELKALLEPLGVEVKLGPGAENFLILTSKNASGDSAVVVTPAAQDDASAALKLGLAQEGKEVSGAAQLRPPDTPTPVAFTGGEDKATAGRLATADDVVPASGQNGIFSLGALPFPRFNLLCLPGLTSADGKQLGEALAYCKEQRAVLLVDPAQDLNIQELDLGNLPALGEHGAIYYPRLRQAVPVAGGLSVNLDLPPCGAVAGAIARVDAQRGVWKAPAGLEAGLVGFDELTATTNDDVSDLLNPKGVNVLRRFAGAGTVIWGARTLKGDDAQGSEFKFLPVRRLTNLIASSLFLGTQFAVFEPNDPDLWAQLRLAVGTYMRGLFHQGAFQQSEKRAESDSFYVVCDETVNPQSEVDLGRVNVAVGFAPLKPAEFVVITITQISQLEE
jgi:uncharacterized protein